MTLYLHEEDIRRESLELGRAEGKADATIELLEELGKVSQKLQDKIFAQTDLALLSTWHKIAAKADSIEDFIEKTGLNK